MLHKVVEITDDEDDEFHWEIPNRYRFTPLQQIQTMLEIVTVLGEVSLVHRECNLTELLAAFKKGYTGTSMMDAVKLYDRVVRHAPRLASLASVALSASAEEDVGAASAPAADLGGASGFLAAAAVAAFPQGI